MTMSGLPELPPLDLGLLDLAAFSTIPLPDLSLSLSESPLDTRSSTPMPATFSAQRPESAAVLDGRHQSSVPSACSTPGHKHGTYAFPPTPAPASPKSTVDPGTFAFPPTPDNCTPFSTNTPLPPSCALPPTPPTAFDLPPTPDSPHRQGTPMIHTTASDPNPGTPAPTDSAWFSPAGSALFGAVSPSPLSSVAFAMSVARAHETDKGKEKELPPPPPPDEDVPEEVSADDAFFGGEAASGSIVVQGSDDDGVPDDDDALELVLDLDLARPLPVVRVDTFAPLARRKKMVLDMANLGVQVLVQSPTPTDPSPSSAEATTKGMPFVPIFSPAPDAPADAVPPITMPTLADVGPPTPSRRPRRASKRISYHFPPSETGAAADALEGIRQIAALTRTAKALVAPPPTLLFAAPTPASPGGNGLSPICSSSAQDIAAVAAGAALLSALLPSSPHDSPGPLPASFPSTPVSAGFGMTFVPSSPLVAPPRLSSIRAPTPPQPRAPTFSVDRSPLSSNFELNVPARAPSPSLPGRSPSSTLPALSSSSVLATRRSSPPLPPLPPLPMRSPSPSRESRRRLALPTGPSGAPPACGLPPLPPSPLVPPTPASVAFVTAPSTPVPYAIAPPCSPFRVHHSAFAAQHSTFAAQQSIYPPSAASAKIEEPLSPAPLSPAAPLLLNQGSRARTAVPAPSSVAADFLRLLAHEKTQLHGENERLALERERAAAERDIAREETRQVIDDRQRVGEELALKRREASAAREEAARAKREAAAARDDAVRAIGENAKVLAHALKEREAALRDRDRALRVVRERDRLLKEKEALVAEVRALRAQKARAEDEGAWIARSNGLLRAEVEMLGRENGLLKREVNARAREQRERERSWRVSEVVG